MEIKIWKTLEEVNEKVFLIAIVGNLDALKYGAITIDEAEKFLFSPYMVKTLKSKKFDPKIIQLVERGCELEDIETLIPEKLNTAIDELKNEALNLIKGYAECKKTFWVDIQ